MSMTSDFSWTDTSYTPTPIKTEKRAFGVPYETKYHSWFVNLHYPTAVALRDDYRVECPMKEDRKVPEEIFEMLEEFDKERERERHAARVANVLRRD